MEQTVGYPISHFVAIGGGANSPLWRQMLADASGKPVHISTTVEASALGAAMIAAFGAGWFNSITEAAETMSSDTTAVNPNHNRTEVYNELLGIYRKLYHATADINHAMIDFAGKQEAGA
jgi:xylulokinase